MEAVIARVEKSHKNLSLGGNKLSGGSNIYDLSKESEVEKRAQRWFGFWFFCSEPLLHEEGFEGNLNP